jgi:hypothetical protein
MTNPSIPACPPTRRRILVTNPAQLCGFSP